MDNRTKLLAYTAMLGMRIVKKSDSRLMRLIGLLMFWNRGFMTRYYTTIGRTIYAPDPEALSAEVLAHESVHFQDGQRLGQAWFGFLYLLPQALFPLGLLGFLGFVNPWLFWLFAPLLLLLPWPACWRRKFELRGYKMSLMVVYLENDFQAARNAKEFVVEQFTGAGYYFMWPFEGSLRTELGDWLRLVRQGDAPLGEPYDTVRRIIQQQPAPKT